jgi:hypothetical protein
MDSAVYALTLNLSTDSRHVATIRCQNSSKGVVHISYGEILVRPSILLCVQLPYCLVGEIVQYIHTLRFGAAVPLLAQRPD